MNHCQCRRTRQFTPAALLRALAPAAIGQTAHARASRRAGAVAAARSGAAIKPNVVCSEGAPQAPGKARVEEMQEAGDAAQVAAAAARSRRRPLLLLLARVPAQCAPAAPSAPRGSSLGPSSPMTTSMIARLFFWFLWARGRVMMEERGGQMRVESVGNEAHTARSSS